MRAFFLGLTAALLMPAAGYAAGAATIESTYTDIDFKKCKTVESDEADGSATSTCPGLKGYPVIIGEGDLRMFVSFGPDAANEPAMQQTLGPFNHLGKKIEWRLSRSGGAAKPFATIIRWITAGEDGTDKGQVLVVTQIKPGATCQIALIDALAVKNANEMARQIADQKAGQNPTAARTRRRSSRSRRTEL